MARKRICTTLYRFIKKKQKRATEESMRIINQSIYPTNQPTSKQTRPLPTQLLIHLRNRTILQLNLPPFPSLPRLPPALPDLRRLIATLNQEMVPIPLEPDMPIRLQLLGFRPAATAALEDVAGRGVEGKGEEVLGFDEVGDETAVEDEVGEAEEVGEEDSQEDDVEDALPVFGAAGGVVLGAEGGVEGLVLGGVKYPGGRSVGVIPIVDEWRVGEDEESRACKDGEGFSDRWEKWVEIGRVGNELGKETGI